MSREAYLSSDDSALLRNALRSHSGESCLEIGAGNCGGLIELSERFQLAVGTDIRRPSDSMRGSAEFFLADAASCFRGGCFDLVAFNPPYLPSSDIVDSAVDGGDNGVAVAAHFLSDAMRVVRGTGRIVFVLSDASPLGPIRSTCEEEGFCLRLIETRRLFYESLSVYEVSRARAGRR